MSLLIRERVAAVAARATLAASPQGSPLPSNLQKLFLLLTGLYFLTSLGHFGHNAEFICQYPNLPASITRARVYGAWAAITSVGVLGFLLIRKRHIVFGLALVAFYAALGFDGLGHYAVAPIELHTFTANLTILSEVFAAALLLAYTLFLVVHELRVRRFVV